MLSRFFLFAFPVLAVVAGCDADDEHHLTLWAPKDAAAGIPLRFDIDASDVSCRSESSWGLDAPPDTCESTSVGLHIDAVACDAGACTAEHREGDSIVVTGTRPGSATVRAQAHSDDGRRWTGTATITFREPHALGVRRSDARPYGTAFAAMVGAHAWWSVAVLDETGTSLAFDPDALRVQATGPAVDVKRPAASSGSSPALLGITFARPGTTRIELAVGPLVRTLDLRAAAEDDVAGIELHRAIAVERRTDVGAAPVLDTIVGSTFTARRADRSAEPANDLLTVLVLRDGGRAIGGAGWIRQVTAAEDEGKWNGLAVYAHDGERSDGEPGTLTYLDVSAVDGAPWPSEGWDLEAAVGNATARWHVRAP